jgi:hypothetical protein
MSQRFNLVLVGHPPVQHGMEAPLVPGVMVMEKEIIFLVYIHTKFTQKYLL